MFALPAMFDVFLRWLEAPACEIRKVCIAGGRNGFLDGLSSSRHLVFSSTSDVPELPAPTSSCEHSAREQLVLELEKTNAELKSKSSPQGDSDGWWTLCVWAKRGNPGATG